MYASSFVFGIERSCIELSNAHIDNLKQTYSSFPNPRKIRERVSLRKEPTTEAYCLVHQLVDPSSMPAGSIWNMQRNHVVRVHHDGIFGQVRFQVTLVSVIPPPEIVGGRATS